MSKDETLSTSTPDVSKLSVDLAKVLDNAMLVPFVKSVGKTVLTVNSLGSAESVVMPPTFVNLNSVPE